MPQPFSSRDDIKGDFLQETLQKALEWVSHNRQTFFSIVGTVAVVLVVAAFVVTNFKSLRKQGWERYSQGENWIYANNPGNALNSFEDVITNFSRTPAATYALLAKADILSQQKRYPEAIDAYKKCIEKNPPKLVLPFALSGLGISQENSGDFAGAIETYKRFVSDFPDHFLSPKIYESLARTYEMSRNADGAKEVYEKIITMFPATIWADKARVRYQALAPQPFQGNPPAAAGGQ